MKKYIIAIGFAFLGAGCASLHSTVLDKIHEGDTSNHVVEVLGKPDSFSPSARIPGATAWYYSQRSERCGFTIQDQVVKYMACGSNPDYISPAARFGTVLQGAGNGMQNASRQPAAPQQRTVNCTTTQGGGGTAYTNCY